MAEIEINLGALRRKRGVSAIHLAAAVGVGRQTIHAIEAGSYVPNTALALRLARALDATVEELFTLSDSAPVSDTRSEPAVLLPGSVSPETGQAMQLCRVDNRLMASPPAPVQWYFPQADAVAGIGPERPGKTRVRIFDPEADFVNRILIAGCDPGISVLSRHAREAGVQLVLAHRNSSEALALLQQGSIHVAGTHLRDDASGESNLPEVGRLFPKASVAVVSFAVWEEGIVTAKHNPKAIRSIEDFIRKDVRIVNRAVGAGSRRLLDSRLKDLRIKARDVRGYNDLALGHLPAAWQVQSGAVDSCLSTRAAARVFGLDFIPLVTERYDLVIRNRHLDLPRMQTLFDTLSRSHFRRELEGLGGYDTSVTGKRVL